MDTEIQLFGSRISDIGKKFNPIYHIISDSAFISPIWEVPISGTVPISFITDFGLRAHLCVNGF